MLPAPPPMSDRDEVIALLRAWQSSSPDTRGDPSKLPIASIVAAPIYRVAITRIAEQRGVRVRPRMPGPRRAGQLVTRVDPWTIEEIALPLEAKLGRRIEKEIEDAPEIGSDCERCRGEGQAGCTACGGSGYRPSGQHGREHPCATCNGTGRVVCTPCGGLGGFVGPQVAWAEIVEGTVSRIVRPSGLPEQAVLDVDAAIERGAGVPIARDDHWGGSVDASIGARDPSAAQALVSEVQALSAELDQTSVGQARAHRLEIRRSAVYRVNLADGRSFLVWGTPARVEPENALDESSRVALRTMRWLGIGVLIAIVMMWLARH